MSSKQEESGESCRSIYRKDLFRGQVALVTGGGTGIGRAIAQELAHAGCKRVVIASRRREICQEAAAEINQLVGREVVVAGPSTSLRKEDEIKALIQYVVETHGSLDLLVNNAGGQFISPAGDISRRGFAAVVDTNLSGTFLTCREAYQQYMRDHGGSIVNITLGNRNGMPGMSHSGAARAGVENLSASLATEWIESGIRINCVRPGIIFTESGFANYGDAAEEFMGKILKTIPARRLGTAQEISSAAVWLLSEGASYVTGAVVAVDGGSSFTLLPIFDIDDTQHLKAYGVLPKVARL